MQTYNRALSLGFNVISERNRIKLWQKKMDAIKRVSLRKVGCLLRLSNVIQCSIEFDCFHSYDDLSQLRYQRHIEINKEYFC